MKKSILLMGFAACLVASNAIAADKEETPLAKQMEAMNDAYKAIKKETDPVKGAELARQSQEAAIKSALEVPDLVKEIKDPAEKAKATILYKKMMAKVLISFCEVEEAFAAGKMDDVAKIVDSLKNQKKEGHDKFVPEE